VGVLSSATCQCRRLFQSQVFGVGYRAACPPGCLQVLTALELARQARIAANRAYLAGLGLGPNALHSGQVQPLAPDDPVMLQVGCGWDTE
jgi:hypothetical protein